MLAVIVCFGLSALASVFGLAAIIGAFLAGMVFAEYKERWPCEQSFEAINELMSPFFFVFVGIQVSLSVFADLDLLLFAIAITVLAMLTKFLACGLGARSLGRRSATIVGIGMSPRGEVGIIVASIGLSVGILNDSLFAVVVFMSIATTLIAPPLLQRAFLRSVPTKEEEVPHQRGAIDRPGCYRLMEGRMAAMTMGASDDVRTEAQGQDLYHHTWV